MVQLWCMQAWWECTVHGQCSRLDALDRLSGLHDRIVNIFLFG